MYIIKRSVNLWAKYRQEKTKDLQITVSISKEPNIIYKLINILITVQMPKDPETKKNMESRIPNTQNSLTLKEKKEERGEKKKQNPYLCSK